MRLLWANFLIVILYFSSTLPADAISGSLTYPALKGLTRVSVLVERPEKGTLLEGYATAFKTAIEVRLRQHGMKIAPNAESGCPSLYVNVTSIQRSDVFISSVSTSLGQRVLSLNLKEEFPADVWGLSDLGFTRGEAYGHCLQRISTHLDTFLNDWYAANGK